MKRKYKLDQEQTPLFDAMINFIGEGITPFFIPSHKMGKGINPKWKKFAGENIFKMDICEVQGLDDISQPKGVIDESQKLAADAWGADNSYFLVNGTSSGIISAICNTVSEGEKLIIPRNAHKSVIFAMIISGAIPVYISAKINKEMGLVGGFAPEDLEHVYFNNQEARGVFSVSPTYHGICSDTKALVDITRKYNGIFIADEAHGNHVYFNDRLTAGALECGADYSCQSIHKMAGSLTQSSLLHTKSDRIDSGMLKSNLQMTQNTSPSYLLEVSLDLARSYIATEGPEVLEKLLDLLNNARSEIVDIPGFEVLGKELTGTDSIYDYEPIRLVFTARELGLEGYDLYRILRDDYKIEVEFGDYYYAICVAGLGTTEDDVKKLLTAIKDISQRYSGRSRLSDWDEELPPVPPMKMSPREAYFAKRKNVAWDNAKGLISAQMIVPYPPGIPVICPGEIITDAVWDYLNEQKRNNRHLHGPQNGILDMIDVVE